jgi:hypothetical protein
MEQTNHNLGFRDKREIFYWKLAKIAKKVIIALSPSLRNSLAPSVTTGVCEKITQSIAQPIFLNVQLIQWKKYPKILATSVIIKQLSK